MILAIDFDGTVVDHNYPLVGADVPGAVAVLKDLTNAGHQLILWTMRSGKFLDAAEKWYTDRGIPLHGVNKNPDQSNWTCSPKAYANTYIDDAALGVPLITVSGFHRKCVDWGKVREILMEL